MIFPITEPQKLFILNTHAFLYLQIWDADINLNHYNIIMEIAKDGTAKGGTKFKGGTFPEKRVK